MTKTRSFSLAALLLTCMALLAPAHVAAGGGAHCLRPFVFSNADVNVVILPYSNEAPDKSYRYQANVLDVLDKRIGGKLAQIMQLDTLYGLRYPFGVGTVHMIGTSSECQVEDVLNRLMTGNQSLAPAPAKALILLWGRFFELEDGLYVQSFVRFSRRGVAESLEVRLTPGENYMLALLGRQTISFAPRRIDAEDFAGIEAAFEEATTIWDGPDSNVKIGSVRIDPDFGFAYRVESVNDATGRMLVQPHKRYPGKSGWVAARSNPNTWPLKQRLPELVFVNALAGYLGFKIIDSTRPKPNWAGAWPDRLVRARERTLSALRQHRAAFLPKAALDKIKLPEGAPELKIELGERQVLALGYVLEGIMGVTLSKTGRLDDDRSDSANAAQKAFQAAQNITSSVPAYLNLGGVAAAAQCCGDESWFNRDAAMRALRLFRAALSRDPPNLDAQHNLATLYRVTGERNLAEALGFESAELDGRLDNMERILSKTRAMWRKASTSSVYFRSGSTEIGEAMQSIVQQAIFNVRRLAANRIVLHAYSDPSGSAERNLAVSGERADSVARALVIAGFDAERIETIAHGEDDPRRLSGEITTPEQGRRVEIHYE